MLVILYERVGNVTYQIECRYEARYWYCKTRQGSQSWGLASAAALVATHFLVGYSMFMRFISVISWGLWQTWVQTQITPPNRVTTWNYWPVVGTKAVVACSQAVLKWFERWSHLTQIRLVIITENVTLPWLTVSGTIDSTHSRGSSRWHRLIYLAY